MIFFCIVDRFRPRKPFSFTSSPDFAQENGFLLFRRPTLFKKTIFLDNQKYLTVKY